MFTLSWPYWLIIFVVFAIIARLVQMRIGPRWPQKLTLTMACAPLAVRIAYITMSQVWYFSIVYVLLIIWMIWGTTSLWLKTGQEKPWTLTEFWTFFLKRSSQLAILLLLATTIGAVVVTFT